MTIKSILRMFACTAGVAASILVTACSSPNSTNSTVATYGSAPSTADFAPDSVAGLTFSCCSAKLSRYDAAKGTHVPEKPYALNITWRSGDSFTCTEKVITPQNKEVRLVKSYFYQKFSSDKARVTCWVEVEGEDGAGCGNGSYSHLWFELDFSAPGRGTVTFASGGDADMRFWDGSGTFSIK